MNKVILIGRLSQPVDYRLNGENGIAKTSMAVQREFKDKQTGEYGVDFINLTAFGRTADFLQKYFVKGMRVGIEGHIQTGSYVDKNNQKRYTFDVIVDKAEFVESKGTAQQSTPQNVQPQSDPVNDGFTNIPDDIPELPFN